MFGLAIGGYLLYIKFKNPERNLIDVPPPSIVSNLNTKIDPKRDLKISIAYIYMVENYKKDLKESVYHGAVVNALAIGYTMLGCHHSNI